MRKGNIQNSAIRFEQQQKKGKNPFFTIQLLPEFDFGH